MCKWKVEVISPTINRLLNDTMASLPFSAAATVTTNPRSLTFILCLQTMHTKLTKLLYFTAKSHWSEIKLFNNAHLDKTFWITSSELFSLLKDNFVKILGRFYSWISGAKFKLTHCSKGIGHPSGKLWETWSISLEQTLFHGAYIII